MAHKSTEEIYIPVDEVVAVHLKWSADRTLDTHLNTSIKRWWPANTAFIHIHEHTIRYPHMGYIEDWFLDLHRHRHRHRQIPSTFYHEGTSKGKKRRTTTTTITTSKSKPNGTLVHCITISRHDQIRLHSNGSQPAKIKRRK